MTSPWIPRAELAKMLGIRPKTPYLTGRDGALGPVMGRLSEETRRTAWVGYPQNYPQVSDAARAVYMDAGETARLRQAYESVPPGEPLDLGALAESLGRLRSNVCRQARKLGLPTGRRKHSDAAKARMSETKRLTMAFRPHPRGMLGKQHTDTTKQKLRDANQRRVEAGWVRPPTTQAHRQKLSENMTKRMRATPHANYSRCKHGRRGDLDGQFSVGVEANYARILNWMMRQGAITGWGYEVDTFWFEKIRRGVRSYTPDFKIRRPDGSVYYVEVKGWMDAKSHTKIKRMAKYHPKVELVLVGAKEYRHLAKTLGPMIPGWEAEKAPKP